MIMKEAILSYSSPSRRRKTLSRESTYPFFTGLCVGALLVWCVLSLSRLWQAADGSYRALESRSLSSVEGQTSQSSTGKAAAAPAAATGLQPSGNPAPTRLQDGIDVARAAAAATANSITSSSSGSGSGTTTFIAVLTRYAEDLSWLSDNDTALMDNSTGTPSWIMPIAIYQSADIGPNATLPWPVFPGLPDNATHEHCKPLPAWPAWAKRYVASKNKTRLVVPPGSFLEAERAAKLRLGMKWSSKEAKMEAKLQMGLPRDHPDFADPDFGPDEVIDPGSGGSGGNSTAAAAAELLAPSLEERIGKRSAVVLNRAVSPLQLRIVPNRGAEAMGYLTAIIEEYHNLPDVMLFMHGHRTAWHTVLGQDWTLRRLAVYPPKELNSVGGYLPLGCQERWHIEKSQIFPNDIDANWVSPNGPRWHEALAARYAQAWREHLGEAYGGIPVPEHVKMPCAASFAATKEAILRRPLSFYEGMRGWMLRTHIENKWLGIVLEFNWHIMMTGQPVVDPSQERCLCKLYSVCNDWALPLKSEM